MEKTNIKLTCKICLNRNYSFLKNKNSEKKLVLKKYCPTCERHTEHAETR